MAVAIAMVRTASDRDEKLPEATAPILMAGLGTTMLGGIFIPRHRRRRRTARRRDGATAHGTRGKTLVGATVTAGVRF